MTQMKFGNCVFNDASAKHSECNNFDGVSMLQIAMSFIFQKIHAPAVLTLTVAGQFSLHAVV